MTRTPGGARIDIPQAEGVVMGSVQYARTVVATMLVVAGLSLVPASPAGAVVTLTVTPDTGLVDGTTVTVDATSDPAPFATGAVCDVTADLSTVSNAASKCGQAQFFTNTDGSESWSFEIERVVTPVVGGALFDCITTACMIAYGTHDTETGTVTDLATVPISFVDSPLVDVTPDAGLVDGQSVDISVAGLTTETEAQAVVCLLQPPVTPPIPPGPCTDVGAPVANPTGAPIKVPASRVVDDGTGTLVDCATVGCTIGVGLTGGPAPGTYTKSIDFTTSFTIDANPQLDLVRDQVINVSAANIPPGDFETTVQVCHTNLFLFFGDPDIACNPGDALIDTGFSASYSSTLTIPRRITANGNSHDCGHPINRCNLVFYGRTALGAGPPLAWARTAGITYLPFLESAGTGLTDGQSFDVTVRPAVAGNEVFVGQCPPGASTGTIADADATCVGSTQTETAAEVVRAVAAQRHLPDPGGGDPVDCAFTSCTVTVLEAADPATAALTSDSDPLTYARTVRFLDASGTPLNQNDDVVSGTAVTAEIRGAPTGAGAWAMQCAYVFDPTMRFVCGNVGDIETPFDGEFDGTITALSTFVASDNTVVQCVLPTRCIATFVAVDSQFGLIQGNGRLINVIDAPT